MPTSSIIVTPGDAAANAYVSLAVADQYHLDRPAAGTAWADAAHPAKPQAILWATKLLDRLVPWTGTIVNDTQALLWPRNGMYYRNGYSIPNNIIPLDLQHATAEFAVHLLKDIAQVDSNAETAQIERLGVVGKRHDVASVQMHNVSMSFRETPSLVRPIHHEVYFLLPDSWLVRSARNVELLRA